MVIGSCYSIQGKSHRKKNIVCQDASIVKELKGNWTVMAIADGLGSCSKSDVGSKTAVETAVKICSAAFPFDGSSEGILAMLRTAFNCAMRTIKKIAEDNNDALEQYDTTLDVVIFNGGNKLYYGHCGDGGIFVLDKNGRYEEITEVQEGEELSSVCPLRFGNSQWIFGEYDGNIAVVAAFTDGIRDKISSVLLENEPVKYDIALANKYMFVDVYEMEQEEAEKTLLESMKISSNYSVSGASGISDDVTMAILVNTDVCIENDPLDIYEKPDWVRIGADVIKKLYPSFKPEQSREFLLKRFLDNKNTYAEELESSEKLEAALDRFFMIEDTGKALAFRKKHLVPLFGEEILPDEKPETPENPETTPENDENNENDGKKSSVLGGIGDKIGDGIGKISSEIRKFANAMAIILTEEVEEEEEKENQEQEQKEDAADGMPETEQETETDDNMNDTDVPVCDEVTEENAEPECSEIEESEEKEEETEEDDVISLNDSAEQLKMAEIKQTVASIKKAISEENDSINENNPETDEQD